MNWDIPTVEIMISVRIIGDMRNFWMSLLIRAIRIFVCIEVIRMYQDYWGIK